MKVLFLTLLLAGFVRPGMAQNTARKVLPADVQIRIAVQAAPEEKRASAKVYGYSPEGAFIVLREGTNDMVCLAPNPKQAGLFAYAYLDQLDPFMARGRELTAQGKRTKEKNEIREAEVKAGKLKMPQQPTTLYGYWGDEKNLDPATGEIKGAQRRYVIYVPYATAASTGLSDKPGIPGMPWLMDAGSYKAHIMINPESMGHSHQH